MLLLLLLLFFFFFFFLIIQWLKREWEIWILTILERLGCVSQLSYRNIDNTIVESTYGTSDVANYKALIYHPKFIIQYFENTMMCTSPFTFLSYSCHVSYNIFTGYNLNTLLQLFFYPLVTTNNNLPFKICYASVMKIL